MTPSVQEFAVYQPVIAINAKNVLFEVYWNCSSQQSLEFHRYLETIS